MQRPPKLVGGLRAAVFVSLPPSVERLFPTQSCRLVITDIAFPRIPRPRTPEAGKGRGNAPKSDCVPNLVGSRTLNRIVVDFGQCKIPQCVVNYKKESVCSVYYGSWLYWSLVGSALIDPLNTVLRTELICEGVRSNLL